MEVVVSAIIGDLACRSISFLVDRYKNLRAPNTDGGSDDDNNDEERLQDRLQWLLLRLDVIVKEAEQRRITNHAMLRQLDALRQEMYRGHHALDMASSSRHRGGHHKHKVDDDGGAVSRSFASNSQSSPAKRIRLMILQSTNTSSNRPCQSEERRRLQQVVGCLETIISDMKDEFIVFLVSCPPALPRQPYSVHMVLDKCMFGRQMEMERVVAFLLQPEEGDDGDGTHRNLGILPIVGPRRAGKTTLVEHACNDERVREHFSQIVYFTLGDLKDENIATSLRSGRVIKQRRASLDSDYHEQLSKVLVIVELDGDRNSKGLDGAVMVDLFGRFCSMCRSCDPCVSKIIVTSRSDKIIVSLGTTEPLRLDYLTQEAYWYFFKVRAFGSVDASKHPEMVSIALDMAAEMNRCFAVVDAFGGLLRSNFNARFWRLTLSVLKGIIKNQHLLFMNMNDARHRRPNSEVPTEEFGPKISEKLVYHDDYQLGSVPGEVPKISLQDIIFRGARPKGRFDVIGWKSSIPPYHTYAYSCEIRRRPQCMVNAHQEFGN